MRILFASAHLTPEKTPPTALLRRLLTLVVSSEVEYDQVMWIDADTLALRPLDPAIRECALRGGVIGHPGRQARGPIWTMNSCYKIAAGATHRDFVAQHIGWKDGPYIATGLWITNDRECLQSLDDLIDLMYGLTVDSPGGNSKSASGTRSSIGHSGTYSPARGPSGCAETPRASLTRPVGISTGSARSPRQCPRTSASISTQRSSKPHASG